MTHYFLCFELFAKLCIISHNALKTASETVETNSLKLTIYDYIMFNNMNYKYQLHKDSPERWRHL